MPVDAAVAYHGSWDINALGYEISFSEKFLGRSRSSFHHHNGFCNCILGVYSFFVALAESRGCMTAVIRRFFLLEIRDSVLRSLIFRRSGPR